MSNTIANIYFKMSSTNRTKSDAGSPEVVLSRSDFLAVAAGLSILCGIFIPFPPVLFDILWACSLCLSAALLLVAFSAKSPAELAGFAPLMIFAALTRMMLYTASAKLILFDNTAGTLIQTIGGPLSKMSPIPAIITPPVVAVIVLISVFKAARKIAAISFTCITEAIPNKQTRIETDSKAGVINNSDAEKLTETCFQEAGFFLNAAGTAKLLRCDAVVSMIVILVIVAGHLVVSVTSAALTETALHLCAASAAGAMVLILSPLLAIAIASAWLVDKSSRPLISDNPQENWKGQTIEIVSEQTGQTETVELLNPDFARVAKNTKSKPQSTESIVEFEPLGDTQTKPESSSETIEDYYEEIVAHIEALDTKHTPILLAGDRQSLPVTIAVNVSIRLCQQHRTLLIDTDTNRNAVPEVFDIAHEKSLHTPIETCIENLSIWSFDPAADRDRLEEIIQSNRYQRIVIYAPDMQHCQSPEKLAQIAHAAIVLAPDNQNDQSLTELLKKNQCQVIATMPPLRNR